mmetsp:Transcript_10341/g.38372  ORF Transcript_10341/g.38372 Transcript_10341/m.38372 type:complete len:201 (+) Transcript_10341:942-1544(+)
MSGAPPFLSVLASFASLETSCTMSTVSTAAFFFPPPPPLPRPPSVFFLPPPFAAAFVDAFRFTAAFRSFSSSVSWSVSMPSSSSVPPAPRSPPPPRSRNMRSRDSTWNLAASRSSSRSVIFLFFSFKSKLTRVATSRSSPCLRIANSFRSRIAASAAVFATRNAKQESRKDRRKVSLRAQVSPKQVCKTRRVSPTPTLVS